MRERARCRRREPFLGEGCLLRHSRPHVAKERYIKVFDRTVLEAAEKLQIRIEELKQMKEPCRQRELTFGDGLEQPRTALAKYQAFIRLTDSSLSRPHLARTLSRQPLTAS